MTIMMLMGTKEYDGVADANDDDDDDDDDDDGDHDDPVSSSASMPSGLYSGTTHGTATP